MANIMIVEDNKDMAKGLKDIMESVGHNVAVTYNGQEFLDKVDGLNPDLVLLDVLMPGLKTREILNELKQKKPEIKVILVTAILFSEEELNHLKAENNIVGYVTKPFSVVSLIDKINEVL